MSVSSAQTPIMGLHFSPLSQNPCNDPQDPAKLAPPFWYLLSTLPHSTPNPRLGLLCFRWSGFIAMPGTFQNALCVRIFTLAVFFARNTFPLVVYTVNFPNSSKSLLIHSLANEATLSCFKCQPLPNSYLQPPSITKNLYLTFNFFFHNTCHLIGCDTLPIFV